mgnify:CR=1 FL=1
MNNINAKTLEGVYIYIYIYIYIDRFNEKIKVKNNINKLKKDSKTMPVIDTG